MTQCIHDWVTGVLGASGDKRRTGRITKTGRKELRWILVEAARTHPYWKAEFERLSRRIGKSKAWVAIARKLLAQPRQLETA